MRKSEWTVIVLGCAAMMAIASGAAVMSSRLAAEQRENLVEAQMTLAKCEKEQHIESCEELRRDVFRKSASLSASTSASSYMQAGMLGATQQAVLSQNSYAGTSRKIK